jgi:hypothetical protein
MIIWCGTRREKTKHQNLKKSIKKLEEKVVLKV